MAARAGVIPTTLQLKAIDSTKAPPCPTIVYILYTQSYIHTYTYNIHTCLYTDIHIYMHTYTNIHTHTYIHICTYLHVYLFTYVNMYPWYLHVIIYILTYMYIHIYIYNYTYIHLYMHELSMSHVCIKYTYIAYIHICVLVEFCVSFVVTF